MATDELTEFDTEPMDADAAPDDERGRRRIGAIVLAIVVALIVLWWILTQTTVVPDLTGLDPAQARDALRESSLKVGDVSRIHTSQHPAGSVADQTPFAGSRVLRGTEVDLALASGGGAAGEDGFGSDEGASLVTTDARFDSGSDFEEQPEPRTYPEVSGPYVPMVQALTEDEAVARLDAAGYSAKVKYGPVTSGPGKGRVYFQEPEPDAYAARGTVVVVWVSTGGPTPGSPYPVPKPEE